MKRNRFLTFRGLLAAGLTALLFGACAGDGFDDETFSGGVVNTQLLSPTPEDITIRSNSEGSLTIISWNVVYGASKYECKVTDLTQAEPVVLLDSIVDGCSFSVKRVEDANYQFTIRTLADTSKGNKDAAEATVVSFNTFVPEFAVIPEGDLYEYFQQEDAIPADTTGAICYNLVEGGQYTMSKYVDFGGHYVVLRCTNANNKPTIVMGETGGIRTSAPFTLKNLVLDYTASAEPAISMSKEPDETIKGLVGGSNYYNVAGSPIYVTNCDFKGMKKNFFFDNNLMYCIETLIVDNCTLHFDIPSNLANHAFIYAQGGFIKDLTLRNSSWWNTGEGNLQYFVRYNNSGRLDRGGYDRATQTQSVNHQNCTFYRMGYGQWANYSAFSGQAYTAFDVQDNIWVDCCPSGGGIARRLLGGRVASTYNSITLNNNTYWNDGASEITAESEQSYDLGNVLQSDPALRDPAHGDLTPTGAEQVALKTGDQRWYE